MDSPLPTRFALYIPGSSTGNRLQTAVENLLCEMVGGVTSYPAKGTFKLDGGQRVSEHIQVLECFCEAADWADLEPRLQVLAAVVGALLKQQAMAFAVDGRMRMISPACLDSETDCLDFEHPERLLSNLVASELSRRSGN